MTDTLQWLSFARDSTILRALHFNHLDVHRKRELLLANDLLVALHEFIEDGGEPPEQYINAAINDGEFIRMLKAFLKSVIEHAEQSGSRF